MKIRLLLNGSFRSFFRLHIGWGEFANLLALSTFDSSDYIGGCLPRLSSRNPRRKGRQSKQRDQNRSDRLAESVNRRGLTFSLPVKGQLLSEEQILGREGGSGSGQSDSEPEDIVDRA